MNSSQFTHNRTERTNFCNHSGRNFLWINYLQYCRTMYSIVYQLKPYILLTEWTCVFHLTLGLNSDQVPTQNSTNKLCYVMRPCATRTIFLTPDA